MMRTSHLYSYKSTMMRSLTIMLLIATLFSTIIFELISNSPLKITLLEHIQTSIPLSTLIELIITGWILFIVSIGFWLMTCDYGVLVTYTIFSKLFQLFLPITDLINLLFIYHYKTFFVPAENSFTTDIVAKKTTILSTRFVLTLLVAFIRLIINVEHISRKCDNRWKRKVFVIFDLLLFILVNISFIRYLNFNLFRVGRQIICGILIFQLNDLFYNESFWIDAIYWNKRIRYQFNSTFLMRLMNNNVDLFLTQIENFLLKTIYFIIYIRWIILSFMVCLFDIYIFRSIIVVNNKCFSLNTNIISILFKSYGPLTIFCCMILYILHWDMLQNRNALDTLGISRFCIGIDLTRRIKSTKELFYSTDIFSDKDKSSRRWIKQRQRTCTVCYDDKSLIEFSPPIAYTCQHSTRSICNACLFQHVQQTFQITFTDDICCPEVNCHVKLDYHVVRKILHSNDDNKLVERYDRYIVHRQLEHMDEFIWCSNPSCNYGQLNAGGASNRIVTCFNCRQKTCFSHRVKWHEGLTCEEYDRRIDPNDESTRRWIVKNSKKCPNCPYQIEKNEGCDHMKCIKCHHEFCWSCLADFRPIRKDGNHRHDRTCKHYAAYDDV